MRTRSKLLLAGFTAALMLSMAVTSASANRLSVSNRNFRITWAPLVLQAEAIEEPIRCNVTFEGSFHSNTITKTNNLLIGHVSRASLISPCTGGEGVTINNEALPWHVQYRGFVGRLPNIEGIVLGLIGAKFTVRAVGLTCVTTTTATSPGLGTTVVAAGGEVNEIRAVETAHIHLEGSFFCQIGGEAVFSGRGTIRLLGSTTTRIRLTLI